MMQDTQDHPEEEEGKEIEESLAEMLETERKKSEEYLLRLKYLQADFENYRKRVEKDSEDAEESVLRRVMLDLLRILDELELAVAHSENAEGEFLDGIKMVLKGMNSTLEGYGLERIPAVGKRFDPTVHEAVESKDEDGGDDLVVEEVRPGYTFRGKVIRPSLVKVGKGAGELVEKKGGTE